MSRQPSYPTSLHSDSDSERDFSEEAAAHRSPPRFRHGASSFVSRQEPNAPSSAILGGLDDGQELQPSGLFSRRARRASRSSRSRAQSLSALALPRGPGQDVPTPETGAPASLTDGPPSTSSAASETPFRLFAPAFSQRQLDRLSRSAQRAHERDERQAKKGHGGSNVRAELKVAMGVLELVESERKQVKRGRSSSVSQQRTVGGGGMLDAVEDVLSEYKSKGVIGAYEAVEEQFLRRPHRASEAGEPARPSAPITVPPVQNDGEEFTAAEHRRLAEIGGTAALAGVFSAGMALYEHEKQVKAKRSGSALGSRPSSRGTPAAPSSSFNSPIAVPTSLDKSPPSVTPGLASNTPDMARVPGPPTPQAPATPYFSQLTPTQHHLVQHAAAALLLKDQKHGTLHDDFEKALGGIEHLVERVEESILIGSHSAKGKRLPKLFGVPLPDITKHEGVDSFHGANPKGTVRIPEFIDHCITALMQMDVTTEGIMRRSGSLRVLSEITNALNNSGGNDTVIDLAALDPITLADLLKRFLAALPHPVLTGHLFDLFIACSHIKNVGLRRRSLHLVICLMPRVNRDVFEVIAVFLHWLSQFAHVTIKDGNKMDLTNIATVMAPTLLRPAHRDPKPGEYPSMIAAVLGLLEEQHILHAVPYELAQVLHLDVPHEQVHHEGGSAGLIQHLARLL